MLASRVPAVRSQAFPLVVLVYEEVLELVSMTEWKCVYCDGPAGFVWKSASVCQSCKDKLLAGEIVPKAVRQSRRIELTEEREDV